MLVIGFLVCITGQQRGERSHNFKKRGSEAGRQGGSEAGKEGGAERGREGGREGWRE